MSINSQKIPFDPAKWPFFYGWFMILAAGLGILSSIPGQTFGVSAFTEPLIESLPIDRTGISLAYMLGTAGSALLLTWGGKAYDAWGARITGFAAASLMGLVLLSLSRLEWLIESLTGALGESRREAVAFALLAVGFLVLRFSGQGVLTMASRNMLMKWFDHRRGLANGIIGLFVPVVFSVSPLLLNLLVLRQGWRQAWFTLGVGALLGVGLFILVFFRDNPESCGLRPDGGLQPLPNDPRHDPVRDFTLKEARRTLRFWVFNLTIALHALISTALTFHIVSIFDQAMIDQKKAFAIFIPSSIITVFMAFFCGWISDHIRLKKLLFVLMAGTAIAIGGIFLLNRPAGYWLVVLGNGIAGGVFGLLMTVSWPRFFGRRHLGAISGFHMSWVVGFSAVGPYLMGLSLQHFGSYRPSFTVCLAGLAILFILALGIDRPARPNASGANRSKPSPQPPPAR